MALSTVATTLDHRAAAWPGAAVISSLPAHALLRFVHLDTDVELLVGFRHPCASGTRAAGPADCHRCRTVAGRDSASGAPGFESLNSPSPRLEQGLDLDLGPLLLARRGSVSAEVGASFAHAPAPLWECWREFPGWRGYRWHRPRPGLAERPRGCVTEMSARARVCAEDVRRAARPTAATIRSCLRGRNSVDWQSESAAGERGRML